MCVFMRIYMVPHSTQTLIQPSTACPPDTTNVPQVQRGSKAAAAAELPGLSSSASEPYKNTWDGVRRIMRSEGVRGLFRGSLARISFHTPLTMISMSLYDECKKFYGRQLGTALS